MELKKRRRPASDANLTEVRACPENHVAWEDGGGEKAGLGGVINFK